MILGYWGLHPRHGVWWLDGVKPGITRRRPSEVDLADSSRAGGGGVVVIFLLGHVGGEEQAMESHGVGGGLVVVVP